MEKFSRAGMIAVACVLALLSGLAGGLLALWLDEPDVVVTERLVELAPLGSEDRVAELSADDLERLRRAYVDATGADEQLALGVVHEMGARVCELDESAAEILDGSLGPDIAMDESELVSFVEQVRSACP